MKRIKQTLLFAALLAAIPVHAANAPAAEKERAAPVALPPGLPADVEARIRRLAERLTPQTGDIRIPSANAVLHLGEDYYFLPAEQARSVLTDAWGNPPDATADVLAIVFPRGKNFYDDTWGAVITFQDSGYVSDDDAEAADYDELLAQIRAMEPEVNARRTAQGYPAQHLAGWAQPPAYDRATHSVVWAQNIQVTGDQENSLNYDIRMLGRRGVLSLNLVTVMSKLDETRAAAQRFAAAAEFEPGARYADFQPGTDRTAEYGVGGLVAAGVGVAVAQKAGLFAVVLIFLKKFGIFIVAGIALAFGAIRRLFRREEEVHDEEPDWAEPEFEPAPEVGDAPVTLEKS